MYLTGLNSGVDLLIGADVPEALQPREIIPAAGGGPYATRVDLGWVINGPTGRKQKYVPCSGFFITSKEAHPMCAVCTDLVDAPYSEEVTLKRLSVQVMQRRYPRMFWIDRMVRCGLFQATVSTTIRSRIKYTWFSTVPPSFI